MPESIEVATLLDPRFEEIMEMFSERPHTFAHADTRLDNIFFQKMVLMKLLLLTFNCVYVEMELTILRILSGIVCLERSLQLTGSRILSDG